jgi:2-phosphosulfolactate phosphatase
VRKIELFLVPREIPDAYLKGKLAVIIDVLRACTTISYALQNGAKSAVPAQEVEEATRLLASLDRGSTLLCGERNGLKIKGFDLGNSPLEYTESVVSDKTLIMASTNGTPAMARASAARAQVLCSFVNIGVVAEAIGASKRGKGAKSDIAVICSGRNGKMALEDAVCGGMLVTLLHEAGLVDLVDGANDAAVAARDLYLRHSESLEKMIRGCTHGRYLESIGFGPDLKVCSKVDSVFILPAVRDGVISPIESGGIFESP